MIAAARGPIAVGLLTLLLVAACGLKGPLYLPDRPEQAATPPAESTPASPPKRRTAPRPAPQSQKEDAAGLEQAPTTPPDPADPANPEPVSPPPER